MPAAQKRKADAECEESKLERLRADAPDLADQVTEEKLTLAEALGAGAAQRFKRAGILARFALLLARPNVGTCFRLMGSAQETEFYVRLGLPRIIRLK
jgi:hypothetical protein